jgi:F0F1-type ATP synthase assembly protein I
MSPDAPRSQLTDALSSAWDPAGAFLGSILSGLLVGYLADRWLDTGPWLLLVGFGLGCYSGFMRLWALSKTAEGPRRD